METVASLENMLLIESLLVGIHRPSQELRVYRVEKSLSGTIPNAFDIDIETDISLARLRLQSGSKITRVKVIGRGLYVTLAQAGNIYVYRFDLQVEVASLVRFDGTKLPLVSDVRIEENRHSVYISYVIKGGEDIAFHTIPLKGDCLNTLPENKQSRLC